MIVIALGANLPGRYATPAAALDAARNEMIARGLEIAASSRIYKTAPVPISDQPWYFNAVVAVQTHLPPRAVLAILNGIERDMGRVREARNAPRVIDLDLIAYNDEIIGEPDLIVPHPRMDGRAFVLLPLRDIAPHWAHPRTGKRLSDLVASLPSDQMALPQWFSEKKCFIMGIVNATPDSFSDGGAYDPLAQARRLLAEGADIIDIGGESTRPGADPLDPAIEQARILPVIEGLQGAFISADTRNAATMRASIAAGASMVNDVTALTHDPESLSVIAASDVPVCLMHMRGTPQTMQDDPVYDDVVEDVFTYLSGRIAACAAAGIDRGRIVADPGFGFGKTADHNRALLDRFDRFLDLGVPLLAGLSRKRFLGPDLPPRDRIPASIAAACRAAGKGARILRVHDVAQTRRALIE